MAGKVRHKWRKDKKGKTEKVDRPKKEEAIHLLRSQQSYYKTHGITTGTYSQQAMLRAKTWCGIESDQLRWLRIPFMSTREPEAATCEHCLEEYGLWLLKQDEREDPWDGVWVI